MDASLVTEHNKRSSTYCRRETEHKHILREHLGGTRRGLSEALRCDHPGTLLIVPSQSE